MPTLTKTACYHCGDPCAYHAILEDDKNFCCSGCLNVYKILCSSKLGNYYHLNHHPGESQRGEKNKFSFLNEPEIASKIIHYQDENKTMITFYIPAIHCSSCIWLLEHLNTLKEGITENRVDFLKKQVHIQFNHQKISLKELAELLSNIGYAPLINFKDASAKQNQKKDNLLPKIALAGFCFGNAMLLSFPAYFGLGASEKEFGRFFSLLSLLFCFPAVFYAGADYFVQAYNSFRKGVLSIDFPLALGISILFIRTLADYLFVLGDGFADSLTGLIFFLLIGKFVQQKTYHHISFDRDYRSFFPVAVDVIDENEIHKPIALEKLKEGDRISVKNEEIIPADAILLKGDALIDFSFVTGEATPIKKVLGEIIYAGGRQKGSALTLEVIKPVSQGYLTALWNNEAFDKNKPDKIRTLVDKVSHYFSICLLALSFGTLLYWLPQNWDYAINAFTAILIVACPCALALSTPFTMAAALSIFDKNKFYLKNTDVVEQLASINTLVFDKTGTVTLADDKGISFSEELNSEERALIYSICKNSNHPLSLRICAYLGIQPIISIQDYFEIPGAGITVLYKNKLVAIGSSFFVNGELNKSALHPEVHVKIGEKYLGYFIIQQQLRACLQDLMYSVNQHYQTFLLSGDNSHNAEILTTLFKKDHLHFRQSPLNKLNFIAQQQAKGAKVLMIGDGLNDAGALKQSNAGIAITEHINNFTPGSDAILDASSLNLLPAFLRFAKSAVKIVRLSFIIAICYNIIGISFAMSGHLSPLVAAILMPLSTISIISFTSIATRLLAKKHHLA
ncbi:MAG: heavy metal translocating P-type ATPase metal-binding domain-containing protein [Pelobium sp.]